METFPITKFMLDNFHDHQGNRFYKTSTNDKDHWQIPGWGKLLTKEEKITKLNKEPINMKRHSLYTVQLELSDIYVFDVDGMEGYNFEENGEKRASTEQEKQDILQAVYKAFPFTTMCPYTYSANKQLFHFYVRFSNMIEYKNEVKIALNKKFDVDLLHKKVNEKIDGLVYYPEEAKVLIKKDKIIIPEFSWEYFSKFFDVNKMTGKKEEIEERKTKLPKLSFSKARKLLEEILKYNPTEFDDYTEWRNLGFMIKHEFGDDGYALFDEISMKCKNYNEEENRKRFDTFTDSEYPITIASYFKKLNDYKEKQNEIKEEETYEYQKENFEKNAFLCINEARYYVADTQGNYQSFTETTLRVSYSFVKYYELNNKDKKVELCFIKKWITDKNIRKYDKIELIPPPKYCPENIFNSWKGFAIDKVSITQTYDEEVNFLRQHILRLCNYNQLVAEYVERWMLDIVQNPHRKSNVALLFLSQQGAGKEEGFTKIISNSIGNLYYTKPTNADEHILSKFNVSCKDKFLITIDELTKKVGYDHIDTIKQKITDDKVLITKKGFDPVEYPDYSRYVFLTNREVSLKVDQNERRFVIIDSSNLERPDNNYITILRKYNENLSILKYFFQTLEKTYGNLLNYDWITNRPKTESYDQFVEINTDIEEAFVRDYFCMKANEYLDGDKSESEYKIKAKEWFIDFLGYLTENNYKNYHPTAKMFAMKIKKYNIPTLDHKRMSYGISYSYNIVEIIDFIKHKWKIDIMDERNHLKLI